MRRSRSSLPCWRAPTRPIRARAASRPSWSSATHRAWWSASRIRRWARPARQWRHCISTTAACPQPTLSPSTKPSASLRFPPDTRMLRGAAHPTAGRRQFGQPVGSFQLVQAMVADCQTEIHAARALVLETARQRDLGQDVAMQASMCKYFASEMCARVADRCVQMLGGYGFIADNPVERFYRDVRLFRLYEGTSQIHQLNIARRTYAQAGHEFRA